MFELVFPGGEYQKVEGLYLVSLLRLDILTTGIVCQSTKKSKAYSFRGIDRTSVSIFCEGFVKKLVDDCLFAVLPVVIRQFIDPPKDIGPDAEGPVYEVPSFPGADDKLWGLRFLCGSFMPAAKVPLTAEILGSGRVGEVICFVWECF